MKYSGGLAKKEREEIFRLFLDNDSFRFSEIERALGIRSNMVSYHLGEMIKEGLLEKREERYFLTQKAETYIPMFELITGQELSPVPVVLVAVVEDGKILLIRRQKRPYKGYWAMPGGKILLGESIPKAAARITESKTGIKVRFISHNAVMQEHVEQDDIVKHSFILLFVSAGPVGHEISLGGGLAWFALDSLPEKEVVPSDHWLIKNKLSASLEVRESEMADADGELSGFRLIV